MKTKYKHSVRYIEIENCKRILKLHDLNKNGNEDLKAIVEDKLSMLQEKVEEQLPKIMDRYYYVSDGGLIFYSIWENNEVDRYRLKRNNVFHTKSGATQSKKEIIK